MSVIPKLAALKTSLFGGDLGTEYPFFAVMSFIPLSRRPFMPNPACLQQKHYTMKYGSVPVPNQTGKHDKTHQKT